MKPDTPAPIGRPSITAIVTSYQSESTIARALESVLGQTFPPTEVLLCDDGSTDQTISIAESFEEVQIVRLPHSGVVGISRNRGVSAASGAWVAFLDADDEWVPEHLELFSKTLREASAAFTVFTGNAERRTDNEQRPFFRSGDQPPEGLVDLGEFLRARPVITSAAVVERKAILDADGFPEDEASVSAEDFDLWYRLHEGGIWFDPRVHCLYTEAPGGLTMRDQGYAGRDAAMHVIRRLILHEADAKRRSLLQRALVRDELTLTGVAARRGHWGPMLRSLKSGIAVGPRALFAVAGRSAGSRGSSVLRAALVLTVTTSVVIALLGLLRQKAVASIVGPAGLADLSLMISVAGPVAALSLWPLMSFAKDLNDRRNEHYDASLRSAAATCLSLFFISTVGFTVFSMATGSLRFPLGNGTGFIAAILFALGMVGVGFATSVLTFRGDLARWRRLALIVAVTQALVVGALGVAAGRGGAVWGMAITTGIAGVVLLIRALIRKGSGSFRLPDRWMSFATANAVVMVTFAAAEATLRQVSADSSGQTAAFFQASLSIIGAITAGVAQYTAGRLLPVATAARDSDDIGPVWVEMRRAALVVSTFVVIVGGTIWLLAPEILRIAFAAEFGGATSVLRLVVLGESCIALSTVLTATYLGLGRTTLWATLSIAPAIGRLVSYALLTGSSATDRLGWAYVMGGTVSLALCAASYTWIRSRDPESEKVATSPR